MPALHEVQFSGATHGLATGFSSTNNLTITLSGASSLDSDVSAGYVKINLEGASHLKGTVTYSEDAKLIISGASNVELTGEARNLHVEICSGTIVLELSNFPVNNVDANLSGVSSATIKIDSRLNANISGTSQLYYIGEPTMDDINTSEGSIISKK